MHVCLLCFCFLCLCDAVFLFESSWEVSFVVCVPACSVERLDHVIFMTYSLGCMHTYIYACVRMYGCFV